MFPKPASNAEHLTHYTSLEWYISQPLDKAEVARVNAHSDRGLRPARRNGEIVAQDRKTESLEDYYRQFTTQQLERIRAVAMDMWKPYFKATIKHVPDAAHKIVHDRFHIMQHMGQAVDKVRRQEHRELLRQEDERLKGIRFIWLYREENLPDKHLPWKP